MTIFGSAVCNLTVSGALAGEGATCAGVRLMGPHPHRRIAVRILLRGNGSLDLICWPNPSTLCAPVQIKEQRAAPLIPGSSAG